MNFSIGRSTSDYIGRKSKKIQFKDIIINTEHTKIDYKKKETKTKPEGSKSPLTNCVFFPLDRYVYVSTIYK